MSDTNMSHDIRCGSCIGGSQMTLGCYHSCRQCGGTGRCEHDWMTVEYEGQRWNASGDSLIPETMKQPCGKCAAYREAQCSDDHANRVGKWSVRHPAWIE
jgi:RecJ-like exonuclease